MKNKRHILGFSIILCHPDRTGITQNMFSTGVFLGKTLSLATCLFSYRVRLKYVNNSDLGSKCYVEIKSEVSTHQIHFLRS